MDKETNSTRQIVLSVKMTSRAPVKLKLPEVGLFQGMRAKLFPAYANVVLKGPQTSMIGLDWNIPSGIVVKMRPSPKETYGIDGCELAALDILRPTQLSDIGGRCRAIYESECRLDNFIFVNTYEPIEFTIFDESYNQLPGVLDIGEYSFTFKAYIEI
jgi:hypothetical protein